MINSNLIARSKPVSEQVKDLLYTRIQEGIYTQGERMPSEERLAQEFNVSRATIRTALAALAAEGLVLRRHGDGTYPTPNVLEVSVRNLDAWNIVLQIQKSGRNPSTQVLEHGLRSASPPEREKLALQPSEQVFGIRRLFFADDLPVMLAVHVIRFEDWLPDPPPELVELTLLDFLSRYYQKDLHSSKVSFKAILAEREIAATLEIKPGSPVLLLEALLMDDQRRPLLTAWEYYRGEEGFLLPVAPFRTQQPPQSGVVGKGSDHN